MIRILHLFACGLALAFPTSGQVKRVVPSAVANIDGNRSTHLLAGYGAGCAQQVILGTKLAPNSAVIFEVALRADGSTLAALPALSFANTKLWIGVSHRMPSHVLSGFSGNRTSNHALVYSGTLRLPAQNTSTRPFNIRWKLARPYVYRTSAGNLLLEWEIPGKPTNTGYLLDMHFDLAVPYTYGVYGVGGKFASNEQYTVTCPSPVYLRPGGRVDFLAAGLSRNYPGVVAWGFSRTQYGPLRLPYDLSAFGAPGNFLNCSIDLVTPLFTRSVGSTWEARRDVPIPSTPVFSGFQVFAQAIFVDVASNSLGLVFSPGLAMTLGTDATATLLGAQCSSYKQASETYLRGGFVIEFTGGFN